MILFAVLWFALNVNDCRSGSYRRFNVYGYSGVYGGYYSDETYSADFFSYMFAFRFFKYDIFNYSIPYIFYLGLALSIIGLIFYFAYLKVSITVTDKRVYGTAAWGKRVDLPLDKITAVATGFGHGITVATSSGSIRFKMINNNKEIYEVISKLLIERQEKPIENTTINQELPQSNADELQKYKNLLDNGTITQEEFDAKKKQLLGL